MKGTFTPETETFEPDIEENLEKSDSSESKKKSLSPKK